MGQKLGWRRQGDTLFIREVPEGKQAFNCGVKAGWEIVAINGWGVGSGNDLNAAVSTVKQGGGPTQVPVTLRMHDPSILDTMSVGGGSINSQISSQMSMQGPPPGAILNIPMDFAQKVGAGSTTPCPATLCLSPTLRRCASLLRFAVALRYACAGMFRHRKRW